MRRRLAGQRVIGPQRRFRDETDERVPRGPFAEWLEHICPVTIPQLAELVGVNDRVLRTIARGTTMKNGKNYPNT